MDAQQALADLTEISSQIRAAVVFDEQGKVAGSTFDDTARGEELARGAAELLALADGVKSGDGGELTQLEAATGEGSVFVVRQGPTRIAATTGVDPTVGLVFYDLKSALRNLETEEEKPKPGTRKKASSAAAKKSTAAAAKKPAAEKKPAAATRKPATRKKKDAS
jgi:predicted regulator of Ras-like GTPase activity (Roadblock/LC7/MglB family)